MSGFGRSGSLSDTEVAENDVEDVLDVHASRKPAKRPRGQPQFLGQQFLSPANGQRAAQRLRDLLEGQPMPFPRHQRWLTRRQRVTCEIGQRW